VFLQKHPLLSINLYTLSDESLIDIVLHFI